MITVPMLATWGSSEQTKASVTGILDANVPLLRREGKRDGEVTSELEWLLTVFKALSSISNTEKIKKQTTMTITKNLNSPALGQRQGDSEFQDSLPYKPDFISIK